jgi:hypothetical protein
MRCRESIAEARENSYVPFGVAAFRAATHAAALGVGGSPTATTV